MLNGARWHMWKTLHTAVRCRRDEYYDPYLECALYNHKDKY